jgi:hypothetical protein
MALEGSTVILPRGVRPPLRVFVNGVEQAEGEDYRVQGDRLVFTRSLAQEGRLGFWRWASMVLGIAGSYRRHETVDVQYEVNGRPRVAANLKPEPEPEPGRGDNPHGTNI